MTTAAAQQALHVAERLADPATVLEAARDSTGISLAHGLAGTALLHARLSGTDPGFAAAATDHWAAAAAHARQSGVASVGVFGDGGGLASSLIIGSGYLPDPEPHLPAVRRAARWMSAGAVGLARRHQVRRQNGDSAPTWAVYDLINGLSGIGRVLLAAHVAGHPHAEPGLLASLHTLTELINTSQGAKPGWWLPAHRHPSGVRVHPSGAATTGLAHGIAGPLAFLAIASRAGLQVDGQAAAIRRAADWLTRWRVGTTYRWPPYITGDQLDGEAALPVPGRVDAWCYGTPGIGRALISAGEALRDPELVAVGHAALASLSHQPSNRWDVEGPTLCHGASGLLQCAAGSAPGVAVLAADLVATAYDPRHCFGFQHHHRGVITDEPGLLTGAAGVALALADYSKLPGLSARTRWDALLLLC